MWAWSVVTEFAFKSHPEKVPSFNPMTKNDELVIFKDKTGILKFLSRILFIFVKVGYCAFVMSQALTKQSWLAENSTS